MRVLNFLGAYMYPRTALPTTTVSAPLGTARARSTARGSPSSLTAAGRNACLLLELVRSPRPRILLSERAIGGFMVAIALIPAVRLRLPRNSSRNAAGEYEGRTRCERAVRRGV